MSEYGDGCDANAQDKRMPGYIIILMKRDSRLFGILSQVGSW